MSPPRRRAGIAILRVELDDADPERLLIRVKTVDDVVAGDDPAERAFASPAQALEHLSAWLEGWPRRR
jgi:hypothetical protein